jgi:large subunit ribosomal protein L19
MTAPAIEKMNAEKIKDSQVPAMRIGDTVKVHILISEGGKERIQAYSGTVIARDGHGATETFTVRRVTHGVGVEKVFPVHTPHIKKIEVTGSTHVRRAKLYYLRDRSGKSAKLREKIA